MTIENPNGPTEEEVQTLKLLLESEELEGIEPFDTRPVEISRPPTPPLNFDPQNFTEKS